MLKHLGVFALALIFAVVPFSPAFAAPPQTITANVDISVPFLGKAALGTLVLQETGTPEHMVERWSFNGQVNGQPAQAAGVNLGHYTGTSYVGEVTEINVWNIPGVGRPQLPFNLTITSGNGVIYLGITTHHRNVTMPLAVQGVHGLPAPFQGNLAISVTNAATFTQVRTLPRTGAAPDWLNWAALALIVVGAGALAASRRGLRAIA